MAKKTFVAVWDGKVVGHRTSPHDYKYAVIVRTDVESSRDYAYNYKPQSIDIENFRYYRNIVNHPATYTRRGMVAEAKRIIDAGFDAYIAEQKKRAIDQFETRVKRGDFNPKVGGYFRTHHGADKLSRGFGKHYKVLGIVELQVVSTQITGNSASAMALNSHCDNGPASSPIGLKR